jgi:cytochrome b pre-mRNA-processing protein 3
MILGLFSKNKDTEAIFALYSAIVAQSRQTRFYADWQVPDTITGRFDLLSLHMALVFRRLRRTAEDKVFAQKLFDMFFKDMDRSLREMGVGDLSIAKRIQKMGNLFFGLLTSLDEPLANHDMAALEAVLARNVYAGQDDVSARPLADYLMATADELALVPVTDITAARLWTTHDQTN